MSTDNEGPDATVPAPFFETDEERQRRERKAIALRYLNDLVDQDGENGMAARVRDVDAMASRAADLLRSDINEAAIRRLLAAEEKGFAAKFVPVARNVPTNAPSKRWTPGQKMAFHDHRAALGLIPKVAPPAKVKIDPASLVGLSAFAKLALVNGGNIPKKKS